MISKEQYGEWKQHPATQFFWQFLRDRKDDLTRDAFDLFIGGVFDDNAHVHRGRIIELTFLEQASFDNIQAFYEELNAGSESENDRSRSD